MGQIEIEYSTETNRRSASATARSLKYGGKRMGKTLTAVSCLMVAVAIAAVAQLPKLPEPFATPSVSNSARIVPKTENAQLKVPAGFSVSLYADNMEGPRTML